MSIRPLLSALLALAATPTLAEPADPLAQARELRSQGDAIRQEAERRHGVAKNECLDRFLVNACLADAAEALRAETARARELERQARELERQERKREFAEREAQRLADAPAREAAAAARAERNREEAEVARRRVERKQAEAAAREAPDR